MQGMAREIDNIETHLIEVDGEPYAIWEDEEAGEVVIEGATVAVER